MKATLFLIILGFIIFLGCTGVGYQPSYIISQDEASDTQKPDDEHERVQTTPIPHARF